MLTVLRNTSFRFAIAVIAAYLLVLQGLFAPGAAARATIAAADAQPVICFSHPDGDPGKPAGTPDRSDDCCIVCAVHASAALPGPAIPSVILPVLAGSRLHAVALPQIAWIAPIRRGFARAPPRVA